MLAMLGNLNLKKSNSRVLIARTRTEPSHTEQAEGRGNHQQHEPTLPIQPIEPMPTAVIAFAKIRYEAVVVFHHCRLSLFKQQSPSDSRPNWHEAFRLLAIGWF
jgi:hypothetical protein